MELNDYLNRSKEQRTAIIQTAKKVLLKTFSTQSKNKTSDDKSFESFMLPNPQGLKIFESGISLHLKKFFRPGLNENPEEKTVLSSNISVNDRIKRTYTKNSAILKKKQVVILPKNYYYCPIKIPPQISKTKHFSVSPLNSKADFTEKVKLRNHSRLTKVYEPILSKNGDYEQRSKLHNY